MTCNAGSPQYPSGVSGQILRKDLQKRAAVLVDAQALWTLDTHIIYKDLTCASIQLSFQLQLPSL